jgi:hypothetical protein
VECAGVDMVVIAKENTLTWKMSKPLKLSYIFDYEQYAVAFEEFQKGLRYMLEVQNIKTKANKKIIDFFW